MPSVRGGWHFVSTAVQCPPRMESRFSAAEPTLGYLFQARMALVLALEGAEDAALVLEGLDDLTFYSGDDPKSLLQLKHHTKPASLTDASPELWKSLRVWCTHYRDGRLHLPDTNLLLI